MPKSECKEELERRELPLEKPRVGKVEREEGSPSCMEEGDTFELQSQVFKSAKVSKSYPFTTKCNGKSFPTHSFLRFPRVTMGEC